MTGISLPNYSEFGLTTKSSKAPIESSSFSLSNEFPTAMGPKTQNNSRPSANKSKITSIIPKGTEKEHSSEATVTEKKPKNGKKENGDPKEKSQKADIPDLLRTSITPIESSTSSSNAGELVEANFLSTNAVSSATVCHTIGEFVIAMSFLAGGAFVV